MVSLAGVVVSMPLIAWSSLSLFTGFHCVRQNIFCQQTQNFTKWVHRQELNTPDIFATLRNLSPLDLAKNGCRIHLPTLKRKFLQASKAPLPKWRSAGMTIMMSHGRVWSDQFSRWCWWFGPSTTIRTTATQLENYLLVQNMLTGCLWIFWEIIWSNTKVMQLDTLCSKVLQCQVLLQWDIFNCMGLLHVMWVNCYSGSQSMGSNLEILGNIWYIWVLPFN